MAARSTARRRANAYVVAGWLQVIGSAMTIIGSVVRAFWGFHPTLIGFLELGIGMGLGIGLIRVGWRFALPTLSWLALDLALHAFEDRESLFRGGLIAVAILLGLGLVKSLPMLLLLTGPPRIRASIVSFVILQLLLIAGSIGSVVTFARYQRSLGAHAATSPPRE